MLELPAGLCCAALQCAPVPVVLLADGRIIAVNQALAALLRTTPETLNGKRREDLPEAVGALFDAGSPELIVETPTGTRQFRRVSEALAEVGGAQAHYFLDVTEQSMLAAEQQRLLALVETLDTRDAETGLLNRNAILNTLDVQISRSRRYGNPLSLILLRLTPPESVSLPMHTLAELSREFTSQLRWSDHIGRLEAGAFLLVLPETVREDAAVLAAKLAVERIALASRAEGWHIDIQVEGWRKGDDARRILRRLDAHASVVV